MDGRVILLVCFVIIAAPVAEAMREEIEEHEKNELDSGSSSSGYMGEYNPAKLGKYSEDGGEGKTNPYYYHYTSGSGGKKKDYVDKDDEGDYGKEGMDDGKDKGDNSDYEYNSFRNDYHGKSAKGQGSYNFASAQGGTNVQCSFGVKFLRHPNDCTKFYQCAHGKPFLFTCPSGLYFNTVVEVCDWPSNVECSSSIAPPSTYAQYQPSHQPSYQPSYKPNYEPSYHPMPVQPPPTHTEQTAHQDASYFQPIYPQPDQFISSKPSYFQDTNSNSRKPSYYPQQQSPKYPSMFPQTNPSSLQYPMSASYPPIMSPSFLPMGAFHFPVLPFFMPMQTLSPQSQKYVNKHFSYEGKQSGVQQPIDKSSDPKASTEYSPLQPGKTIQQQPKDYNQAAEEATSQVEKPKRIKKIIKQKVNQNKADDTSKNNGFYYYYYDDSDNAISSKKRQPQKNDKNDNFFYYYYDANNNQDNSKYAKLQQQQKTNKNDNFYYYYDDDNNKYAKQQWGQNGYKNVYYDNDGKDYDLWNHYDFGDYFNGGFKSNDKYKRSAYKAGSGKSGKSEDLVEEAAYLHYDHTGQAPEIAVSGKGQGLGGLDIGSLLPLILLGQNGGQQLLLTSLLLSKLKGPKSGGGLFGGSGGKGFGEGGKDDLIQKLFLLRLLNGNTAATTTTNTNNGNQVATVPNVQIVNGQFVAFGTNAAVTLTDVLTGAAVTPAQTSVNPSNGILIVTATGNPAVVIDPSTGAIAQAVVAPNAALGTIVGNQLVLPTATVRAQQLRRINLGNRAANNNNRLIPFIPYIPPTPTAGAGGATGREAINLIFLSPLTPSSLPPPIINNDGSATLIRGSLRDILGPDLANFLGHAPLTSGQGLPNAVAGNKRACNVVRSGENVPFRIRPRGGRRLTSTECNAIGTLLDKFIPTFLQNFVPSDAAFAGFGSNINRNGNSRNASSNNVNNHVPVQDGGGNVARPSTGDNTSSSGLNSFINVRNDPNGCTIAVPNIISEC